MTTVADLPLSPELQSPSVSRLFDDLLEALRRVPDPRAAAATRHPLDAMLALLVVGWCCGSHSIEQTLDFMRPRLALRARLGFTRPDMPSASTYSRLLAVLPAAALAGALQQWLCAAASQRLPSREQAGQELAASDERVEDDLAARTAAIDGKTARCMGEQFVNVFVGDLGSVLAQWPVEPERNELSTLRAHLPALLAAHPWLVCVTLDAGYADRSLAEALSEAGVGGLFQIKGNQPETLRRLERFFSLLPKSRPDATTWSAECGRGRRRRTSWSFGPGRVKSRRCGRSGNRAEATRASAIRIGATTC